MNVLRDRYLVSIVLGVAIFYSLIAVQFIDRLDPLTGDEPFYVMTAISMFRDHDLDESNNFANRDYDEFYPPDPLPAGWRGWPAFPRTLPPHPATTDLSGLHTKHGLGLSILIAAPYELAGRLGAMLVVLLCGLLVTVNMYFLARNAEVAPVIAAAIAAMLAVSMPIAPYSALLFPEVPAALLLVYAVRRLASPSNSYQKWLLTGACIGFLPWLHQRFVPTAVVLVSLTIWKLWNERDVTKAALALAPIALGGLSLVAYNLWLYDSPIQNTADHAGFNGPIGTINATFGLLLDAQWGLLIAAPVYLLAIAGIGSWWRVSPVARVAVIAVVPYVIVVASYRVWWGEWGPPARYLVPIAPFAAGSLAAVVARLTSRGRSLVLGLWAIGMALTIVGVSNPHRLYHQPNGINNLVQFVDDNLGTSLAQKLVSFQPLAESAFDARLFVSLALVALLIFSVILIGRSHLVTKRQEATFSIIDD